MKFNQFEFNYKEGELIKYNGSNKLIAVLVYIVVVILYSLVVGIVMAILTITPVWSIVGLILLPFIYILSRILYDFFTFEVKWMIKRRKSDLTRKRKYQGKPKCVECGIYDTEYNASVCSMVGLLKDGEIVNNEYLCTDCLERFILKDRLKIQNGY